MLHAIIACYTNGKPHDSENALITQSFPDSNITYTKKTCHMTH